MKYRITLLFSFIFFIFFKPVFSKENQIWFYPITSYEKRLTIKPFGKLINEAFYIGKQKEFPNHFYGYHAADDLEILPGEENKDVTVYAAGTGKIVFAGTVEGYGGVILEQLNGTNYTALYGHIRINKDISVGNIVNAGKQIAILGKAFSTETGGERKHLHFGIYKGSDLYFTGHEKTKEALDAKWINPHEYLKQHFANGPGELILIPSSTPLPTSPFTPAYKTQPNFLYLILQFIQNLFNR